MNNVIESRAPVSKKKRVSLSLGIGILFLPIVFAWFTLQKGYRILPRVISFIWLLVTVVSMVNNIQTGMEVDLAIKDTRSAVVSIQKKVSYHTVGYFDKEIGRAIFVSISEFAIRIKGRET